MKAILGVLTGTFAGKRAPFTRNSLSAIDKQALSGLVTVHQLGLEGDEHGDMRVHGGPDKAIHHYPNEHYDYWRKRRADAKHLFVPGSFGENFSSLGLSEGSICLGDIIQIGTVVLEVSQSRQPCWKLNDRFEYPSMSRLLQETGFTGWYYRIKEEGAVRVGDEFIRLSQPYPEWPLSRVSGVMFSASVDCEELTKFLKLPLTSSWKRTIEQRLETGEVEGWSRRLDGA